MVIRTNVASLCAYREYKKTARATAKNLEKLSSGYRINRSADDASGLSASERMRANITELDRCENNALEGLKLAKTADGALAEINDMLRRARELCIQAENGTYSEQELASISDEMNQLFSEIDRITEGSFFNEIQLFRNTEPDFHYEYIDTYTELPEGQLEAWGAVDFIESGNFDEANDVQAPVAAKATFKLSDSIDFNDPNTLEGKFLTIGGNTYYFSSNSSVPAGVSYTIPLQSTVEATLRQLTTYASTSVHSVEIDKAARTVTLTAPLTNLTEKLVADGKDVTSVAPGGNGAFMNGREVNNPLGDDCLLQVDGSGIKNNKIEYSSEITASYPFNRAVWPLNSTNVEHLLKNSFHTGAATITFTRSSPPGKNQVYVHDNMSREDFGKALAEAINKLDNHKAVYNSSGSLELTITNRSTTSPQGWTYATETLPPPTNPQYDTAHRWTSTGKDFNAVVTRPATPETGEQCTITIPPPANTDSPFSFSIYGTTYLYYNSDKNPLTTAGYSETEYSPAYSRTLYDMKGKTAEQVQADIVKKVKNRLSGISNVSVSSKDNVITFSSNQGNHSFSSTLNSAISPDSIIVTPYKPGSSTGVSVLANGAAYYSQDYTIPFSLGSTFDKDQLAGRGFSIGSTRLEFTNGSGGVSGSHTDVDISGANSFQDLIKPLQDRLGNSYKVTIDESDPNDVKLKITGSRSTNNSAPIVVDGYDGITDGSPVVFEGGLNVGHSQKEIDFSSINADNLNDLLGKGFRINCATCKGEYINIFFCWENNGSVPPEFKREDPTTGEIRTIHNIAVELSKVTSASNIVQSIVDQVRPSLKHYTDVAVGSPPTTLIAMEKRVGDVKDNAGQLYLGSVEGGVEANFTYSSEIRKVRDFPTDGSIYLKNGNVDIYVGSEPNPQLIPIHLPYLDLPALRLSPPEVVDLNAADQDASDWLNRVDRANLAISEARGVIGADHNRLEHAVKQLSSAHVDLADAESRIRDTDMAEEMMEHVKLQILTQAQQGMLAQANSRPQQILQLIS